MRRRTLACLFALGPMLAQAGTGEEAKRPFISETHVVAPHRVGDFVLEQASYDPNRKLAGATLRYALAARPETRIDLFVYPVGQADAERTLDKGMADFMATMEAAVDAGYYRNIAPGRTVEFDIELPPERIHGPEPPSAEAERAAPAPAGTPDDPREAARAAMVAGLLDHRQRIDGRRLDLGYDFRGQMEGEWFPMRSRTYLFYRQLYYFKGRISAAESRIDEQAFSELSDLAMRTLVPAVQAYNVGSCGDSKIVIDANASPEDAADALVRGAIDSLSRNAASNCHGALDGARLAELRRDAEVLTIEYGPNDWNEER